MALHIDQIRTDGGTQSRAAINEATVAEYAEAMADENTVFPPVVVYFDGRNHWLADGFHRLEAWRRTGRKEIPADVRQGDRRRAILHSVAANSAHGLRRSNEDKRRAVLTLLEDDEWRQWSNREIARRCAVSESFVRAVRDGLSAHETQIEQVRTVERGGTVYVQRVANIGKAAQAEGNSIPSETEGDITTGLEEPDGGSRGSRLSVGRTADPSGAGETAEEGEEPAAGGSPAPASAEPAPDAPLPVADPDAAERRKLGKLTTDALIEEVLGLKAALREAKARAAKAEAEAVRLRDMVRDFEGDQAETIRRQAKEIKRLQSEVFRAGENARVKVVAARKAQDEAKALRKKLEAQEISFGGAA